MVCLFMLVGGSLQAYNFTLKAIGTCSEIFGKQTFLKLVDGLFSYQYIIHG